MKKVKSKNICKKNWLAIFLILSVCSCHKKKENLEIPEIPVKVENVLVKDVPFHLDTIGHVVSINSVDIVSRVEGELMEVLFEEGQEVAKNQIVFVIDPRPFKTQLKNLEALLEEQKISLSYATDKVSRYSNLVPQNYISKLDFEQLKTDSEKLKAEIEQTQANIENAKLNINYCYIQSPIDGVAGILKITKGNFISSSSMNTPLVIINQISPIYVSFSIGGEHLVEIQKFAKNGVLEVLADLNGTQVTGYLYLIDNEVDQQTAQIKLRAVFNNENKTLWPGNFVRVKLFLFIQKDALLVPSQSIIYSIDGPKIFVLGKNNIAKLKNVELGQTKDQYTIIEKGVTKEDKIVVDGQFNLKNGSKVQIK